MESILLMRGACSTFVRIWPKSLTNIDIVDKYHFIAHSLIYSSNRELRFGLICVGHKINI